MEPETVDFGSEITNSQAQQLSDGNINLFSEGNSFSSSMTIPLVTSSDNPIPARCPTFKEYGDTIKKLEYEIFQLKLRIYLQNKNYGKITPKNAIQEGGTISGTTLELVHEFQSLKETKEVLQRRVRDLENHNRVQDECIQAGLQREEILHRRVQELTSKLDTLDHELALANLRKVESSVLDKSLMTFHINDEGNSGHFHPDQISSSVEEQAQEVDYLEKTILELKQKLDLLSVEVTEKSEFIASLESLLKDKNQLTIHLDDENSKLKSKIVSMTEALKGLGFRQADEEQAHARLKCKHQELTEQYENVCVMLDQMKRDYEQATRRETTQRPADSSPDLGIESGYDHETLLCEAVKLHKQASKDGISSEEKIRLLKALNKDLARKLKHTKLALDKTLERLNKTAEDKEQVEKAVCRQLHKTHGILRAARQNLANPSEPVPLTDLL